MCAATLRLILGDQLSPPLPTLVQSDKSRDLIVMAEVRAANRDDAARFFARMDRGEAI